MKKLVLLMAAVTTLNFGAAAQKKRPPRLEAAAGAVGLRDRSRSLLSFIAYPKIIRCQQAGRLHHKAHALCR